MPVLLTGRQASISVAILHFRDKKSLLMKNYQSQELWSLVKQEQVEWIFWETLFLLGKENVAF